MRKQTLTAMYDSVISRINAVINNEDNKLKEVLEEDLEAGVRELKAGLRKAKIKFEEEGDIHELLTAAKKGIRNLERKHAKQ